MMNNCTLTDTITQHYLVCALWSSVDDEGVPLDDGRDVDDIAQGVKQRAFADVQDFLDLLKREGVDWQAHWSPEQFGHDFWLTRNGHGAGFWDRAGVREPEKHTLGETLTKWAKTFPGVDLYVGDDGMVYD